MCGLPGHTYDKSGFVLCKTGCDKNFIPGLRIVDNISKPLTMYYDNQVAVLFSGNNKPTDGSKHLDLKYYVVKDRTQDQTIKVEHISTKLMLADPLTKGLPHNLFKQHALSMGLVESL
jgi:hypothetical protein